MSFWSASRTASYRTLHGRTDRSTPSMFLKEIEPEAIEQKNRAGDFAKPAAEIRFHGITGGALKAAPVRQTAGSSASPALSAGDRVRHSSFGEGTVLSVTPMGGDSLVEIVFDRVGTKQILANDARLRQL